MRIKVSTRQCVTSYHTTYSKFLGHNLWTDRDIHNQEIDDPEDVNKIRYDLAYLILQNIEGVEYKKILRYIQNTSSKYGFCDQENVIYYRAIPIATCVGCCFAYDNERGEPRCRIEAGKCKLITGHYKKERLLSKTCKK